MIASITAIVIFALGVYGVLAKRDIIRIFIGATLMLSSVTMLLVALGSGELAYSFVLFIWVVEVLEVIVALAIFIYLAKQKITDIGALGEFKW